MDTGAGDFQQYLFTALDASLTQWSAPVMMGIAKNHIDTFVLKVGATYHAFLKSEDTRYLEHATARKLTGPWTLIGQGDWAGWGSGMEGPAIVKLDDGTWRMFMDSQQSSFNTDSADLVKWSKVVPLPGIAAVVRHGTVIRDEPVGGGVGGASGAGGSASGAVAGAGGAVEASGGGASGAAANAGSPQASGNVDVGGGGSGGAGGGGAGAANSGAGLAEGGSSTAAGTRGSEQLGPVGSSDSSGCSCRAWCHRTWLDLGVGRRSPRGLPRGLSAPPTERRAQVRSGDRSTTPLLTQSAASKTTRGPQSRSLTATLLCSAALLAAFGESAASAQTAVTVSVDARAAGTPLERVWSFFGYDEVNYTSVPQGKSLLATIGKLNPVPAYVRSHFLLNTGDGVPAHKWGSTNVYTEDGAGNPVYSWTIQDGIFDAIAATGNLPLAEIGFMPQALSTHPNPYRNSTTTALDGGCFYPPKDYDKWAALISEWATHAKGRYPQAVNAWLWEMWNEPNIGYWHGTEAEYFKLYDYTEAALHGVLPDATLGGPAVTAAVPMLQQFLQHCDTGTNAKTNQVGTRLDLVTFHAKGGVALSGGHPEMDLGNQLRIHRDAFTTIASFAKYKQTPIVISEADPDGCAACSNTQNAYRNSPAYGAYEVSMMKRSLDLEARLGVKLKGLVTWAFMFDDDAFFSILRTLATNGIDKPVLNAFKLLGALNGQRLPVTSSGAHSLDDVLANSVRQTPDIDAIATIDGSKVQVLVWNYHDDLVATPASAVHLSVSLPSSFGANASLTHLRVDESHGDAYTVWLLQGSPKAPSTAQLAALEQAMQPAAFEPPRTVAITNGSVAVDFDLPRFGISLLTFTSLTAPDVDAGTGGAAGGPTGGESGGAGGSASGGSDAGGPLGTSAGMTGSTGAAAGTAPGTVVGTAGSDPAAQGPGGGPTASSADHTGCSCSLLGAPQPAGRWLDSLSVLTAALFLFRARTRIAATAAARSGGVVFRCAARRQSTDKALEDQESTSTRLCSAASNRSVSSTARWC